MSHRVFRLVNILTALAMLLSLFAYDAPAPAAAQTPPSPLEILARAKGVDSRNLILDDATTYTLLNGTQVTRIKAHDAKSSQILGGDFENGLEVDLPTLMAQAGREWRAAHGALTKDAVKTLAGLSPSDTVNVSLWLAGDIQSLPKPADSPSLSAGGTSTNSGEAAASSPQVFHFAGKDFLVPLNPDQIPPEVSAAVSGLGSTSALPAEKSGETKAALPAADADGKIEAFKQSNQRYLESQVVPLQSALDQRLAALGLKATFTSPSVPAAYLEDVPVSLVQEIAFWPELDAIYIVPAYAGPSINNARPAQNAAFAQDYAGYNGAGINVAVAEGERAYFANPGLVLTGTYDGAQPFANHPTAVCGIIRSTVDGYPGLANGSNVYSANGSYSNWATMSAALDYATTNAAVINNSWYWDSSNSATFWEADRRLDYYVRYNYDFVAVAAGNFGNGCGGNYSTYVVSPAKGYNVMSVGNYEDVNNINWSDDYMDSCSSFGDPANDSTGVTHAKPEVAAIGASINSTLPNASDPLVGGVGSGTSYASPMVTSLAADIMQAQPGLSDEPEVIRSLIMATALHNVEGGARQSDKDGVGGVDFTAALTAAERGDYTDTGIDGTTVFPLSNSVYAYKGERVRVVINWLSNPVGGYTSDPLPVDLDLDVYRSDGTTLVASSSSGSNNYEIVDFIAPATETYQIKITKFGSYTGSNTWLGTAKWRGEYRISPYLFYSDPTATPLGTQLDILPSEWDRPNYWRVLGVRSLSSDHDLTLYSASITDDPSTRSQQASSYSSYLVDLVAVDGNHKSYSEMEHYRVSRFSGTGGYDINWSNNEGVLTPGTYGPFGQGGALPADVFDLYLPPGTWYISIIPSVSNTTDLATFLYASTSGAPATYNRGLYGYSAASNVSTSTLTTETMVYNAPGNDYYGLVITALTRGTSNYYIKIDSRNFLPFIKR